MSIRPTIYEMGLNFFDMPKCMKTGGTCTLHKNYDFTAGEVEVQPLSVSVYR